MRRAVLAACLAGLAVPAAARTDCSTLATQLDINFCAQANWELADAELNRLWKIVKPAADARGSGQALLAEQRAWLGRRDATCEAERDGFAGGSIAPLIYWECMERLTLQRNAELGAMR